MNAAIAETGAVFFLERRVPREAVAGALFGVCPIAIALVYGAVALRSAPPANERAGVPVVVIQPNFAVGSQWRADQYGANLDGELRLTARGAAAGRGRIVFWPESALTFFLEQEPAYRAAIASLLRAADLELLLGGPRVVDPDAPTPVYYNSVFALDPRGTITGVGGEEEGAVNVSWGRGRERKRRRRSRGVESHASVCPAHSLRDGAAEAASINAAAGPVTAIRGCAGAGSWAGPSDLRIARWPRIASIA